MYSDKDAGDRASQVEDAVDDAVKVGEHFVGSCRCHLVYGC